LEAFGITGKDKYLTQAVEISKWFYGGNHLNAKIYDHETGLCYDGLNQTFINKNSGAESTIEALLIFQELEKNGITLSQLYNTR
jgi:hypothetical protein